MRFTVRGFYGKMNEPNFGDILTISIFKSKEETWRKFM
jgi:hypothetical protein